MNEQFLNILSFIGQALAILAIPIFGDILLIRSLLRMKHSSLEEARHVLEVQKRFSARGFLWVLIVADIVFFIAYLYPDPTISELAVILCINLVLLPFAIYPWAARYLAYQRLLVLEATSSSHEQEVMDKTSERTTLDPPTWGS